MRPRECGLRIRLWIVARLTLDGVEQRARGIEVQRIAEFVPLGRACRFDTRRLFPRVVTAVAALAERPEQIAQGAITEEVERLVGDFEGDRRLIRTLPAAASLAPFAFALQIRRRGDVAFVGHAFDDLLDQLLELRACFVLIAVGGIAEQALNRFSRQDAAVEERIENRVVQRLHRPLFLVVAVRVPETAREQQVGELRDQILEIQLVERITGEFGVAVLQHFSIMADGLWLMAHGRWPMDRASPNHPHPP